MFIPFEGIPRLDLEKGELKMVCLGLGLLLTFYLLAVTECLCTRGSSRSE